SDVCSSDLAIELQTLNDTEAVTQRVGQHAGAGGGTDQGEGWQIELDRPRGRTFADHDIELIVLHRRVENLLDYRRKAVNFIDKEHIARLQTGQHRRQIASPF